VIDRAIGGVMKGLVDVETDVMEPTYVPVKRFELSFFRNQVIHVFVSEALLCLALYTRIKQGGPTPSQAMPLESLVHEAGFVSHIMRGEFVFNSADKLENNVHATVKQLVSGDVLSQDGEGRIGLSDAERKAGRFNFDSYRACSEADAGGSLLTYRASRSLPRVPAAGGLLACRLLAPAACPAATAGAEGRRQHGVVRRQGL
jgi:hypothetical protein